MTEDILAKQEKEKNCALSDTPSFCIIIGIVNIGTNPDNILTDVLPIRLSKIFILYIEA